MIVAGYSMDLYCDNKEIHKYEYHGIGEAQFGDKSRAGCIKQARKCGWAINLKAWKCYCPQCKHKIPHPNV
jgi:hypothetical protein